MKRTAKYETLPLNRGKIRLLLVLLNAFAEMKDSVLRILGRSVAWDNLDHPKKFRDSLKSSYKPGNPVHLLDQAVFDAVDTLRRFIEAGLTSNHIKARIFVHFSEAKRHYAYWLLKSYGRIGSVLQGVAPEPKFEITLGDRKAVVRYLRRQLRQALGHPPRVKLRRSFALDSSLYRIYQHNGRQYISMASSLKGKRLILPLRGKGRISGNIRLVWNQGRGSAFVQMPYRVRIPGQPATGLSIGIDAGVTEVLATNTGEKLGLGYGQLLDRLSEKSNRTGKTRNKLDRLAEKAEAQDDLAKASHIRRHNLGRKKLHRQREQGEAAVKTVIGQAVRQALRGHPAVVAVEDLSQMRGRTKSRKLSRIVSRWARSALRERLDFRTEAGGSRLRTVNAAYTSQTCPNPACGYVHRDNRHGDRFNCQVCGWDGDADVVAGMNILARVDDPEIHLWTPKERVKAILAERFRRRKETGKQGSQGNSAVQWNGTPLAAGL